MAWLLLFVAGVLEVVWAVGLKYTEGWTRLWPSVFTLAVMLIDFFILSAAMRSLPVGTAYAVWTGIGAVGTAIAGILLFDESREALRLVCILLIVAGIVGLKLVEPADGAR
jgi:quaternary ammonium compound-resistance protein SugE